MMKNFKIERYKVLFFDFDGVILDSVDVKTEAFAKLFEPYGETIVKKVVDYHLINKGVSRYDKFHYYYENILGKSITPEIIKELDKEMYKITMEEMKKADFIEGMPDFLEEYCKEKDSFIVSAAPQTEIREIVKLRGLHKYFQEVKGSLKTKAEHINEIIISYNYKRDECIMFGDAESDLKAAKKAGIDFMGVNFKWEGAWIKDFKDLYFYSLGR